MISQASSLVGHRVRMSLVILLSSVALVGCTSTGKPTGAGLAAGAVIGTVAGATIGNAVGGRDGAIIGGILGGMMGAMIGDAIEKQEIERQRQAALASGRGSARKITNSSGKQVLVRTTVRTVPKGDGSGLSCREAITYLGSEQASTGRACQVRQGGGFTTES